MTENAITSPDLLAQPRVRGIAPRVIGGAFALIAFAVALLAGLAADNPTSSILGRGLVVMLICHPIGYIIGIIVDRTIAAHVDQSLAEPMTTRNQLRTDDHIEIPIEV